MTTFAQQADEWVLDRYSVGEITETTAANYREALRLFAQHAGPHLTIDQITPRMIKDWLAGLRRKGCEDSSLVTRMAAVRSFFKWAVVTERLIDVNPCDRVPNPRAKRHVPKNLDPDEVRAVLTRCSDQRVRLMILLAAQLGARRAEVAGLRVDAVNLLSWEITLDGKGRRERRLPIPHELRQPLERWLQHIQAEMGEVWVFPNGQGGHLTPEAVGRMVGAFGHHMHAYRHTAAVEVLKATGNVQDVRLMLGHQNLATTSRYLAADTGRLREAMEGRTYTEEEP